MGLQQVPLHPETQLSFWHFVVFLEAAKPFDWLINTYKCYLRHGNPPTACAFHVSFESHPIQTSFWISHSMLLFCAFLFLKQSLLWPKLAWKSPDQQWWPWTSGPDAFSSWTKEQSWRTGVWQQRTLRTLNKPSQFTLILGKHAKMALRAKIILYKWHWDEREGWPQMVTGS